MLMPDGGSPLRQRLRPSRPVLAAGDGAVEKLLRVEFPRSADQLLALQADVQAVGVNTVDQSQIVGGLSDNHLIMLINR